MRRVLIDEGDGIAERTNGDVKFLVESEPSGKGGFVHRCFLFVPKVGYRYPLMRVEQESLTYPASIVADAFPQGTAVGNETELKKGLGTVFRSNETKNIVLQLLDLLS